MAQENIRKEYSFGYGVKIAANTFRSSCLHFIHLV